MLVKRRMLEGVHAQRSTAHLSAFMAYIPLESQWHIPSGPKPVAHTLWPQLSIRAPAQCQVVYAGTCPVAIVVYLAASMPSETAVSSKLPIWPHAQLHITSGSDVVYLARQRLLQSGVKSQRKLHFKKGLKSCYIQSLLPLECNVVLVYRSTIT